MFGITGSTGYIGSRLLKQIDALPIPQGRFRLLEQCDTIYHLGGISSTKEDIYKYIDNITYTNELLKRCYGKKFIFISSILANHHDSAYGWSKFSCEQLVKLYHKQGLISDYQIIRLSNVVGPNIKYGHLYDLVNQIKSGYVGYYPNSCRPYMWIDDCISGILNNKERFVTLGPKEITIEDTIHVIEEYFGVPALNQFSGEPLRLFADSAGMTSSEKTIKLYCQWIKENL